MNSTNKINFLVLILLILAISIGCNLLNNTEKTEAEKKSSADGDFVTVKNDSDAADSSIKMDDLDTGADSTDKEKSAAKTKNKSKLTNVKFGKGKTSALYSGAVIRTESDKYILGAKGGQQMNVSISSLENNAVFNIVSPTGENIVSESRSWSGQLPSDGKYQVLVSGTRGNATYKINFAVR